MENTSSIKRPGSPFTISVLLSQTPNPKSSRVGGGVHLSQLQCGPETSVA